MSPRVPEPGRSLAQRRPDLASEWHPTKNDHLLPEHVTAGSNKKVWWQKQCNPDEPPHEWESTIKNRNGRGAGCAICWGNQMQVGINDLPTTHPRLAEEWHPTKNDDLLPEHVTAGSNKKVWWQKQCNPDEPPHEWDAQPNGRKNGTGCSVCAMKRVQIGINDLASQVPDAIHFWHPTKNGDLLPQHVTAGSNKRVWWQKKCNPDEPPHEWVGTPKYLTKQGFACAVCHGSQVQIGINDLASLKPALVAEWHPTKNGELTPEQVTTGADKKVWWQKRCNRDQPPHEWKMRVVHRAGRMNQGCAVCRGLQVQTGVNDLASLHPVLAAEWHPTKNGELTPQDVAATAHKKVWWQKKCNPDEPPHEWKSLISDRSNGSGCAICHGQQVQQNVNDLASLHPVLAAQWHPTKNGELTPQHVTAGTSKKVWWRCEECSYEWQATVANRAVNETGCALCAPNTFRRSDKAWLYFLRHPEWDMQQVGITNHLNNRLADHARNGWLVVEVRGPDEGDQIADIERQALRSLKLRGASLGSRTSANKFDGYTEAWPTASLSLQSISQLMEWIREDDSTP